ncbi:DnaJ domain-containing protein [Tengunoibacter tsumagoiensis]|uniref:J domain-containing protein n=1 Tax=Tengunoibacter tsumagoiensis TaxID=2014871 RepID=A0A402A4H9_9CHLR|nr:DnaJ domain-containing protein [Tengunoibacter tsumagoiensis]GCE14048.1 hypothetical protein KTT_39070 [Tengunoibacter tsumagoiensis]
MDTPENYYAILGVPLDADSDMLKRVYRQLARRFHPDLAGPEGAIEMKRINRAYAVLSDPEQRQSYDTIIGGVIDLRKRGFARPSVHPKRFDAATEDEFSGLSMFSSRGPLHAGPLIRSRIGVLSALSSIPTVQGMLIAAGSLDGTGILWQLIEDQVTEATNIASDPAFTVESLRDLRFSEAGSLLAGWGRLGLHIWDAYSGTLLWSQSLQERAVSAHYSLDVTLQVTPDGKRIAQMALPYLAEDIQAPRSWGVRSTDVLSYTIGSSAKKFSDPLICSEESVEKRQFWAIRMRALSQDAQTLVTFSCAQLPNEKDQQAVVRRWDLSPKNKLLSKKMPQIADTIVVGRCDECTTPYAITPNANMLAFTYTGKQIRICDTRTGTYSEIQSGNMGGNARLAISPDGEWLAVAREDSEINEGVIDLWSIQTGQLLQKFYHPWQISALHFAKKQLIVALTDGTIQIWRE